VLLIASNGVLNVGSSNSECYEIVYSRSAYYNSYVNYLSISIECENDGDLAVLVGRKKLLNILDSVKSKHINLSMEKNGSKDYLVITDDKTSYRLTAQNPEVFMGYGLYRDISDGVIVNSKTIIDAIDRVAYATDNMNPNYSIFKTIGFIFQDNSFFIAATGGNCLAVCDLKVPNNLNGRFGITKTAALSLKKIFKNDKDILFNIVDDNKTAVFKSDNIVFATRIVREDVYPDVISATEKLRKHLTVELKLSKNTVINALKSLMSSIEEEKKKSYANLSIFGIIAGAYYNIKLKLSNNNLNISSVYYNSEINIPVDYTGDEYVIGFNASDLLEAVKNICDKNITLKLPSKNEYPAYVEPAGKCNYLAMVWPIKRIS
jgi:DNA polymerase-3 subunit beta